MAAMSAAHRSRAPAALAHAKIAPRLAHAVDLSRPLFARSWRHLRQPPCTLRCEAVASDLVPDAAPLPVPSVPTGDSAPPPDPSTHAGDWRNKGIFPAPAFIWQKPPPKASLYNYGMEGTATPLILNLVQLIHWVPFVPAIILAAHISTHAAQLQANCGVSPLQVFALLMAPVTQVFGSVMGIVMHEYEGWQVTEFKSPTVISDGTVGGKEHTFYADNDVNIYTNNNEWLRLVAYKFLFLFQGGGLVAMNLGALGFSTWNVGLSLTGLFSAFFLPHIAYMTFNTPWNGQPAYPLGLNVGIPFFIFAAINMYAFHHMFGWIGVVCPLLFMAGGIIEGVVAETIFDQRWHGFAVVLLNVGLIAEFILFQRVTA